MQFMFILAENFFVMAKTGKFSRFYLYVEFAQAFRFMTDSYTYNSNDGLGPTRSVTALERILETTCKDRYNWAKLVDRNSGLTLGFWLPGKGKMTKELFEAEIKPFAPAKPALSLKASVAFLPHIARERAKSNLKPLETVCVRAESTEADMFLSLYRAIQNGVYADVMRAAYIYRGVEKVGEIRRDDTVVVFDVALEQALRRKMAKITISHVE